MQAVRMIVPALHLLLATVLAALPLGLAADSRFLLPLLPLGVVHYWARRRPLHMTFAHAFASGLTLDVLTHGPLGYWSLIYLAGHGLSQWDGLADEDNLFVSWLHFVLVLAGTVALAWLISSGYFLDLLDWRPLGYAALVAAALYPVLAIVMAMTAVGADERTGARERQGQGG